MGVFRKLKDVLFDVDEDDDIIEEKPKKEEKKQEKSSPTKTVIAAPKKEIIKREENTIKEIKIPKEEIPERELIKSESTFNFPLDVDAPPRREKTRSFDYEMTTKKRNVNGVSKMYEQQPKKEPGKPFKPTPIISPVYGILDQNYSKDDIIVKTDIGVKGPDLDSVRKKAYGLEVKEEKQKETENRKSLEERLREKVEEIPPKELSDIATLIKSEPEIKEAKEENKVSSEDTLETDLFKLIDSMYEEKEEESE